MKKYLCLALALLMCLMVTVSCSTSKDAAAPSENVDVKNSAAVDNDADDNSDSEAIGAPEAEEAPAAEEEKAVVAPDYYTDSLTQKDPVPEWLMGAWESEGGDPNSGVKALYVSEDSFTLIIDGFEIDLFADSDMIKANSYSSEDEYFVNAWGSYEDGGMTKDFIGFINISNLIDHIGFDLSMIASNEDGVAFYDSLIIP